MKHVFAALAVCAIVTAAHAQVERKNSWERSTDTSASQRSSKEQRTAGGTAYRVNGNAALLEAYIRLFEESQFEPRSVREAKVQADLAQQRAAMDKATFIASLKAEDFPTCPIFYVNGAPYIIRNVDYVPADMRYLATFCGASLSCETGGKQLLQSEKHAWMNDVNHLVQCQHGVIAEMLRARYQPAARSVPPSSPSPSLTKYLRTAHDLKVISDPVSSFPSVVGIRQNTRVGPWSDAQRAAKGIGVWLNAQTAMHATDSYVRSYADAVAFAHAVLSDAMRYMPAQVGGYDALRTAAKIAVESVDLEKAAATADELLLSHTTCGSMLQQAGSGATPANPFVFDCAGIRVSATDRSYLVRGRPTLSPASIDGQAIEISLGSSQKTEKIVR